jgi:Flp pilus assembly protein TadD
MPRLVAGLRLCVAAMTLALVFAGVTSSWPAASKEGICDINADFALGLEDYPAAITLHRNFLRAHKDNALAHYHLGFAYGMTGRTTDEIREYLVAVRLSLDEWDLFLNLGLAYLGQKDWPNAIKTLQIAVLLGPNHPEAHFNLAIAYEMSGRLGEAIQEITASLRLAPKDSEERNAKAIICAKAGDLVCARDEWTRLTQVAPDYIPARANLTILNGSYIRPSASTSTGLNRLAVAR